MKKAPPVRLSLRKLFIAMLAVGPVAILPSPILASVPQGTTAPFTTSSGTATWNGAGTTGTINASNRAVLEWGTTTGNATAPVTIDGVTINDGSSLTNFNIAAGQTYNFILPSGGAVLNKVSAGSNTTHANLSGLGAAAAIINGTLLSNGGVFVLANGNIIVGTGAQISTASGLTLSTLNENTFNFTATGNLALSGTSQGTIYLGTGAGVASVVGNLTAAAGNVVANNLNVSGDLILNQTGSATALALTTANPTTVGGNFTATSNNGAITDGAGTLTVANGNTTIKSGTGDIILDNVSNDFKTLSANTTGNLTVRDANIISLGASTIGKDLDVAVGGRINTNGIESTGTLTIGGNATLTSTASNNSHINIANNSTIGGTVNASTFGGAITINTVGNLTVGNVIQNVTTDSGSLAAVGGVTVGLSSIPLATNGGGVGYVTAPTVVIGAPPAGGTQATAHAVISGGAVTGIVVDNAGSGYTSVPTVTLDNTGTGATTAATLGSTFVKVLTANVTAASGVDPIFGAPGVYASPVISFEATTANAGETRAAGNVTSLYNDTTGAVSTGAIAISNAGEYSNFPTVTINAPAVWRPTSIVTTGNINVVGNVYNTSNNTTITGASVTFASTGNVVTGNLVTINSTAGNVALGNITGNRINSTAVGGSISQVAGSGIKTNQNDGTSAFRASTGNIILDSTTNNFVAGQIVQFPAANTVTFVNTKTITLGTTNVTGNVTLNATGGSLAIGTGNGTAGQDIKIGGALNGTVVSANVITDGDYGEINIAGGLNLTVAGALVNTLGTGTVTLDAATLNGSLAPSVQLGRVNISTGGAASIAETTTLNLGNITAASLSATSTAGSIINTGDVNVGTGAATFTTSGASTSVITNATNTIGTVNFIGSGGAITVGGAGVTLGASTNVTSGDDLVVTTTNGGAVVLGGGNIGGHLTINSSGKISTAANTNTVVGGNLSLTAADTSATSIDELAAGRVTVTGVTTVAAAGNVTLDEGNDFIGGIVLNQASNTGKTVVYDLNDLTISGSSGGSVEARAGGSGLAVDAPWKVVLGNLTVGSLTANASNGGGGNSGTVTQASGTSIHSEGTFSAITNNANIVITNSGNSAGRVEFYTNGATGNGTGTISYTEDGTVRVGNLASNSNITLRSNFGSIIEDTNSNVVINSRATLNATAPAGSILLGGTTNTTTTVTANVNAFIASAPTGAVAIMGNNNIALGSINANSLTVTATNNITQTAALNVFGTASFSTINTDDTRSITLTNNANNFGPLSFSVGNNTSTVTVTENNTLNLRRVNMLGGGNSTFTATSLNGDIVDTGLGGVRLGGNATNTGSGVVTLVASNGNIVIDDPTSDVASTSGIVFNAKDVTLSVLGAVGSSLTLGAVSAPSAASGNLTVSSALGSINNAGAVTAGGVASFTAPNGSILIGQSGVGFGQLRFVGQQVSISESGNMDILTGSASFGPANLVSGGSITIVPPASAGPVVTFGSTVNMTATGNITIPDLLQAAGLLTVAHTGTANLSALSIQGDLGGLTPVDAGTGPYVGPNP